jgi:hypothetical protein
MNELVKFRLFQMPCCGFQLCWINPRIPNHCPECGMPVYSQLKMNPDHTLLNKDLWLRETPKEDAA